MTAQHVHRVCDVNDLDVGQAQRFDICGHRIAVVRGEEQWFAIGDECSHADYSLAEGDVDLEACTLECFKHGSQFSLTTGAPETFPATRAVTVYELRVDANEVSVTLPEPGADT